MNILDQFNDRKTRSRSLAFRTVFLMNQRITGDATLHTSYKDSTSPRFVVKGFSWGGYGFADCFMILTYLCLTI